MTLDAVTQGACPVLGMMQSMPEEQKERMMREYQDMVDKGQHKPLEQVRNQPSQCTRPGRQLAIPNQEMFENLSTEHSSTLDVQKQEKKPMMGCPFFNKEITDPQGKNITPGYP